MEIHPVINVVKKNFIIGQQQWLDQVGQGRAS